MRIYKILVGSDSFDYEYLTDDLDLRVLNKMVITHSHTSPKEYYKMSLKSFDVEMIKLVGGTIVFFDEHIKVYLINSDHENLEPNNENIGSIEMYYSELRIKLRDEKINRILT